MKPGACDIEGPRASQLTEPRPAFTVICVYFDSSQFIMENIRESISTVNYSRIFYIVAVLGVMLLAIVLMIVTTRYLIDNTKICVCPPEN